MLDNLPPVDSQPSATESRLAGIIASAMDAIITVDAEQRVTLFNVAAEKMFGLAAAEALGQPLDRFIPPRFRQPHRRHVEEFGRSNGSNRHMGALGDLVGVRSTGEEFPVEIAISQSVSGGQLFFTAIIRDLTERYQAAEALQASEERFRSLIENGSDLILLYGSNGKVFYISPSVQHLTGYTEAEFIKLQRSSGVHPEDVEMVGQTLAEVLRRPGGRARLVSRFRHKNGSWRWFDVALANLLDDPHVQAVVANGHDVTDRVLAEEALRDSEQRLLGLIDNAPDIIATVDTNGTILSQNPAFETITGWPRAEWIGRSFVPLVHPDDVATVGRQLEQVARGERLPPVASRVLTRSGQYREMEFTLSLQTGEGQPPVLIAIGRDVTERREQEREMAAVARVGYALRPAVGRNEILEIALGEIQQLFQADEVAFTLIDPSVRKTQTEVTRSAGGIRNEPPGLLGQAVSRYVLATSEPYVSDDLRVDPNFAALAAAGNPAAAACLPLIAHGILIGALWLARPAGLGPTELRALTTIGDMAANAVRRATLHAQTERRLQRLAALRVIDQAVNASFDIKLTLGVLLEQVIRQLAVDAAAVLLVQPAQYVLECAAARGFRTDRIERGLVHYTDGATSRIVLERRAVRLDLLTTPRSGFDRPGLIETEGVVAYYGLPIIAKGQVRGVLEIYHRSPLAVDAEWEDFAEALTGQAAIAVESIGLFNNLERTNADLSLAYDTTLEGWSRALDLRDHETEGHTQRVTEMTLRLAQAMQVRAQDQMQIRRGAILHDIGKMGIPDDVLLKPGPLTEEEWVVMRKHPTYAYEMLAPIAYLRGALDIPYCHHEKWDGTGYPRGLKGSEIPQAARIFAVADVWDALRSDRPYRKGWPPDLVREYIAAESGRHFDPAVVETFLTILGE